MAVYFPVVGALQIDPAPPVAFCRDAEIFSYVVDGELSHADSMGNKESLPRG